MIKKGLCKIHCSTFPGTRKKHLKSRFGLQDGQRILYSSRSSNLLDLFADNHRVLFSDFLSGVGFVIVRAIVYIGVAMYTAVNIPTPAFKPSKSHFLPAHETAVLFLFWLFERFVLLFRRLLCRI